MADFTARAQAERQLGIARVPEATHPDRFRGPPSSGSRARSASAAPWRARTHHRRCQCRAARRHTSEGRKQTTAAGGMRSAGRPGARRQRTLRLGGRCRTDSVGIIMRGGGVARVNHPECGRPGTMQNAVSAEDSGAARGDAKSETSSPPPAGAVTSLGGARWLANGEDPEPAASVRRLTQGRRGRLLHL